MSVRRTFSGKRLVKYEEFFENGSLKCYEERLKYGGYKGTWFRWHSPGILRWEIPHKNGKSHGFGFFYDRKGNLRTVRFYYEGKKICRRSPDGKYMSLKSNKKGHRLLL